MPFRSIPILFFVWLCGCQLAIVAQEPGTQEAASAQEAASENDAQAAATAEIQAAIQSYVVAFNGRDAETLAAHWAPEGVYISRATGDQVVGRDAMVAEFTEMFSQESVPGLAVSTQSIEFISPNVALERGIAVVSYAEDDVVETAYSVVFIKIDGKWLIDRVTEDEIVVQISNSDKLLPLEWMIGEWVDETESMSIDVNCQWTRNQNYISRTFKVTGDDIESAGLQIIGWDPVNNQIRSWLFDTDGSFVSGTWTKSEEQDRWVVQSVATLVDGSQGSYTSIFEPLEDGSYSWRKVNRVLNGELLPSLDEVIVQRK